VSSAVITTAALAMVRTAAGRLVFVEQARGPYAGALLCPGGKIDVGEDAESAARRETLEESGYQAGKLSLTGVYEMIGSGHHIVMFAFLATGDAARVGDGLHHVDGILEAFVGDVSPHPTVRRILNDAGLADYGRPAIEEDLRTAGIAMRGFLVGAAATP
jgi:8-oxo-dGTP diphosphatase